MSEHVRRVGSNYSFFYFIVLFGVIGVFAFQMYQKPRSVQMEFFPAAAKVYQGDKVICERSPCEIALSFWPEPLTVKAKNFINQDISLVNLKHFTTGSQIYNINLVGDVAPLPDSIERNKLTQPIVRTEIPPAPVLVPPKPPVQSVVRPKTTTEND